MKAAMLVTLLVLATLEGTAQTDATPEVYRARASLARCVSVSSLKRVHDTLTAPDKLTELVFFARLLMLSPKDKTAAGRLLELTPVSEDEQEQLMQMMDPPEETSIEEGDKKALATIYDRWPAMMTRAALLAPDDMKNYVGYLLLAPNDEHSNFAALAEKVCSSHPAQFRTAIASLSQQEQDFIASKIFDAKACKTVTVSQQEEKH